MPPRRGGLKFETMETCNQKLNTKISKIGQLCRGGPETLHFRTITESGGRTLGQYIMTYEVSTQADAISGEDP